MKVYFKSIHDCICLLIRGSLRGSLVIVEGMLVGGSLGEGSFGGPFGGGKVFKLGFNGSLLVVPLAGAS